MKDAKEYIRKEFKMEYVEDLGLDHQCIVKIIGLEKYLDLCFHFAGVPIYFPFLKTIHQQINQKIIRKKVCESRALIESKVLTVKQLSKIYGISISTVYNYLKGK